MRGMGPSRRFALNKTLPARPNIGFTICHLSLFPLGFREPEGHLYLNPRASACLSVGLNRVDYGATSGKLEVWFYL